MRAGRLATRRYKVRRRGGGWFFLLLAGIGLGVAASAYFRGELPALPPLRVAVEPAPTLTPEETRPAEMTLSLAGQDWFALQLGVYSQPDAARKQAESYRSRGAGGYVFQKDGYRVLAAAYPSRADAQAVQTQLKTQHGVEAAVVEIVQPEVTLRLTGQQAQLSALRDAWEALEKLAQHLSQLSIGLDHQALDTQAVLSALESERDTLRALNAHLPLLFPGDVHTAVSDLAALLSSCAQSLDAGLNAQNAARFGAQIKYCQLQCLCGMAAYAEALAR